MLPRSVEKQGLTQLVSVRPSVPKVPRSILRFYLKSFIGPSWYLPWVPEVWVAKHFGLYAFAAGEREDLWHSGVSLARLESVSFVEKVGTKAKKMGGGKRRKGILFSPPPSSIFLLSLLLSRSNSSGNICYAVISTRYRLRRTLRVGGKDVFSLCCLQSLLMKMNPLSIKVLCKKS